MGDVSKSGRVVAKFGRWVAKLVARLLAPAAIALWVRIQTSLKKVGDISKGVVNKLLPTKKYTKK